MGERAGSGAWAQCAHASTGRKRQLCLGSAEEITWDGVTCFFGEDLCNAPNVSAPKQQSPPLTRACPRMQYPALSHVGVCELSGFPGTSEPEGRVRWRCSLTIVQPAMQFQHSRQPGHVRAVQAMAEPIVHST